MQRVLIIEDDARVRDALTALLAGTDDLTVAGAVGTAVGAHTALATIPVDSVLLDVQLARRGDGLDLIRTLSRRYPVVAISIDGSSRTPALRAGAITYLEKGGSPDDILRALRAATGPR